MRKKRLLIENKDAVYHVVCRTAFQSDKLCDDSKAVFVNLLKKQAAFSGVKIITYCILDNHVHLLVKVPYLKSIDDQTLIERYRALYGEKGGEYAIPTPLLTKQLRAGGSPAQEIRNRLIPRMQHLPTFVKELKQRFGIWYNRNHQNRGTLWSERFSSILVENSDEVIALVAAYIDMNPVRLNKCQQPQDYAYSNFKNNTYELFLKKRKPNNDVQPLNQCLKQKWSAMSTSKIIGSPAFVQSWHKQHQKGLKGKSKWVASSIENILSFCLTLTEIHHYRKWS